MIRKIIKINDELCNGCGLCVNACHEGAIELENGKARLLHEHYCDGLGDCLPACPTGAIYFEQREAPAYDEQAVLRAKAEKSATPHHTHSCPGSIAKRMNTDAKDNSQTAEIGSRLSQWPIQIKLAPITAPYYDGASLLISADCAAYAYGDFHRKFIDGKTAIIGCPKLDEGNYADKLSKIFAHNNITEITVTRMSVPCCGGIERAVKAAVANCGKNIAVNVVTIGTNGEIM